MERKANRDGHAMGSFELPSMGACLLVENTEEHRALYGLEGYAVFYYNLVEEMIQKAKMLRSNPTLTLKLRENVRGLITSGKNTYKDRLLTMIKSVI
jgi:spore maturation protein CgeB